MKRFVAIAKGRVQGVGYREHVYNETFETNITGYLKKLDTGEVEIVAEGKESELLDLINRINIIQRPIAVKSFTVIWEEPTGAYSDFEIIRGDIQLETFERMDYAGNVLHSMDMKLDTSLQKQDQTLDKQDQMLNKQDQMLEIGKDTWDEITLLRKDTRSYLDDEFREIRKELTSIKDALIRAGIQV